MGTGNSSSNSELTPVFGLEDRVVKQIAGVYMCFFFMAHVTLLVVYSPLLPYD